MRSTSEFAISLCAAYGVSLNLPDTPNSVVSAEVVTQTSTKVATSSALSVMTSIQTEPTLTSSAVATDVNSSTTASGPAQYTGAGKKVDSAPLFSLMGVAALGLAAVL
ncbi:hypothetical protein LTR84_002445 [Exophiala bonariae]|uniref:Uncharacterized protein n=1 Tax=Exophiala bonariae TaxID=1690606 RepID=A0AAV9N9D6_9EURO|nr:hypothetical protein LTR84_002445 [Exophiala bonariae]